jgi:hypothetical protein
LSIGRSNCSRDLQERVALRRWHGPKAFQQFDGVTLCQQPAAASDDCGVETRSGVVMAVEIPDVHIESARHVRQPASRGTIRPVLVFLDLLEGDADSFGQIGLAHAELPSTNGDSLP